MRNTERMEFVQQFLKIIKIKKTTKYLNLKFIKIWQTSFEKETSPDQRQVVCN